MDFLKTTEPTEITEKKEEEDLLTGKIIGAAIEVHQKPLPIFYNSIVNFFGLADLFP